MCAPLGAATLPFAASLGIGLIGGLVNRREKQEKARQTYQTAVEASQSVDESFANQQSALGARLREEQATTAQSRLAKTIQGLQAKGALKTRPGIAGNLVALLDNNIDRQTANSRESINQSLESFTRQYRRNVQGLEIQRDSKRNRLQDSVNEAYNQIPSLSSVILDTATQGLSTYASLA